MLAQNLLSSQISQNARLLQSHINQDKHREEQTDCPTPTLGPKQPYADVGKQTPMVGNSLLRSLNLHLSKQSLSSLVAGYQQQAVGMTSGSQNHSSTQRDSFNSQK